MKNNPANKQLEKDYICAQKDFRRCQRRELYLKEVREVSKLESVAK